MLKRLFNIAIAVRDVQEAAARYERLFGLKLGHIAEWPDLGIRTAMLPVGDTTVELVQPLEPGKGPVARFLDQHGEGLYIMSLQVDDLEEHTRRLEAAGARYVKRPGHYILGKGAEHHLIAAFLHPKDTGGVAVELAQFLDRGSPA
ncbi:MAG: VOC family protein [Chloroflexi bacterium]|nr:VOC family protein [Chloroflexota bacterium]